MDFRYGQVEAALAEVLKIPPENMGAFRARLRHLRNIGLLNLPKPGSGRSIAYSWQQAVGMLLAIQFENVGVAPRVAANTVPQIAAMMVRHQRGDQDTYVAIYPLLLGPTFTIFQGEEAFLNWL